jgi:hypothetical protein
VNVTEVIALMLEAVRTSETSVSIYHDAISQKMVIFILASART